jgi:uncharacterized protein YaaQ
MKLILAIVGADAVDPLSTALVERKYTVTQISSVGGFLRRGNSTLVIGVDEAHVQDVLGTIRAACAPLTKPDSPHAATIFVLDAVQFVQI